ncbi:MAG: acyl-CoA dehydratase activase [Synergistaceae bacterium]|nr:acyl-CoA dehydratase activase [Synergistaceae bacterium]
MPHLHMGLDIGSTTAKAVLLDERDRLVHSRYCRHFSDVRTTVNEIFNEIRHSFNNSCITLEIAGSGGMGIAEEMKLPFIQELIACSASVSRFIPQANVCIELGGEDAKLTYFDDSGADQRMNETCAGGTGAFLDHMALLMGTDPAGLNELAAKSKIIYPIASRCGVFAKTDVQSLMKEGAEKADIAASIFQAVVNQTISGLACGRKIVGNVAFLGGPLYFLPELRKRFSETLRLLPVQSISPENSHLFVALGAALLGKKNDEVTVSELDRRSVTYFSPLKMACGSDLPPLFSCPDEKIEFQNRHSKASVQRKQIISASGPAYLGIDVGSTTTKAVLTDSEGNLLFSDYRMRGGSEPIHTVREIILELYSLMPEGLFIKNSCVTGYGEKLIQSAFGIDIGEIETVAHTRAAKQIDPDVDFIIDIGGQDMKCLKIEKGNIKQIFLNEACSSGCGSFLQNFAESLGMEMDEFVSSAERSLSPVDLGSRCTVFMNSKVRQAQKEGAAIEDISAGLVYSVVRNALYKVLKIRKIDDIGEHIVVQGGTFKNNALLRAFEKITGRNVLRPEISEFMGAYGAALVSKDREGSEKSSLISKELLISFDSKSDTKRCSGCGNNCLLTITTFNGDRRHVTGNMCSNGENIGQSRPELPPNLYIEKYKRLFDYYVPIEEGNAPRGTISIPRVLNMYENYPFWFTLFTDLGFRVELSSGRPDGSLAIDTIPSQTLCFPAKLVHRHLQELIDRGAELIFYPGIQQETKEYMDADDSFNCPVVAGYPDVAGLNVDGLISGKVSYIHSFFPIDSPEKMVGNIVKEFRRQSVTSAEARKAIKKAYKEQEKFKKDIGAMGDRTVRYINKKGLVGVVLAGHPYHLDPEVNHGIPELINGYNVAVLTEDSVAGRPIGAETGKGLKVIDQWVYHSRLYRTAYVVANDPEFSRIEMVQLNSFGCGLDAISADQAAKILEKKGRLHTLLKIDESKNNGAVRIRVRSLLAAVRANDPLPAEAVKPENAETVHFSPALGKRTILCPPLSQYHFQFLESIMRAEGYDFHVLPEGGRESAELGLNYVNNDACYPAMIVVGQFLNALKSGQYDPKSTDCFYAQTGGSCRASNYVPLLRRALDDAGFEDVRVLAVNSQGKNSVNFRLSPRVICRSAKAMVYGDLLMRLLLGTRPYELRPGEAKEVYDAWSYRFKEAITNGRGPDFSSLVSDTVADFNRIPVSVTKKPKVGIVGEILVKYHSGANERLVDLIESSGGEAVLTDIASFLLYCLFDPIYRYRSLSGSLCSAVAGRAAITAVEMIRKPVRDALRGTRFGCLHDIYAMADKASSVVSCANQAGEGWLLTAEMISLIESGVKKIICVQPFACLPNHITGKGVIKELRRRYCGTSLLALDYDSGTSSVNQMNRIRLLMS